MTDPLFLENSVVNLFGLKYPVIQGGMVWCAGWKLAAAVSNAGGLGLIGAGSMSPDLLREHIRKCKVATQLPFGVNVPLLYKHADGLVRVIEEENVPVVFTSAGNPAMYTTRLKEKGIKVAHVVSNVRFAEKAQKAGVNAVVAEGFEAGGHNGREEITTLCLVPQVKKAVDVSVIAAGGVGTGESMLSVMALGADGVQVGSRFVASAESSAHDLFKQAVIDAGPGDTMLTLKEVTPVRLLKNEFFNQIMKAYSDRKSPDELRTLLGRGRSKKGMFEGDLVAGELEIGQISGLIGEVLPAAEIVQEMVSSYRQRLQELCKGKESVI